MLDTFLACHIRCNFLLIATRRSMFYQNILFKSQYAAIRCKSLNKLVILAPYTIET